MLRRIIPTAERTVIRGGDKKLLTNESRLENADQGRQDRQFSRHPHTGMVTKLELGTAVGSVKIGERRAAKFLFCISPASQPRWRSRV
jgi:hypothetical protein